MQISRISIHNHNLGRQDENNFGETGELIYNVVFVRCSCNRNDKNIMIVALDNT